MNCYTNYFVLINEYKIGHVTLAVVKFVELRSFVIVKQPENVLFTPAMHNPDDAFECCTMFKFGQAIWFSILKIKQKIAKIFFTI